MKISRLWAFRRSRSEAESSKLESSRSPWRRPEKPLRARARKPFLIRASRLSLATSVKMAVGSECTLRPRARVLSCLLRRPAWARAKRSERAVALGRRSAYRHSKGSLVRNPKHATDLRRAIPLAPFPFHRREQAPHEGQEGVQEEAVSLPSLSPREARRPSLRAVLKTAFFFSLRDGKVAVAMEARFSRGLGGEKRGDRRGT